MSKCLRLNFKSFQVAILEGPYIPFTIQKTLCHCSISLHPLPSPGFKLSKSSMTFNFISSAYMLLFQITQHHLPAFQPALPAIYCNNMSMPKTYNSDPSLATVQTWTTRTRIQHNNLSKGHAHSCTFPKDVKTYL